MSIISAPDLLGSSFVASNHPFLFPLTSRPKESVSSYFGLIGQAIKGLAMNRWILTAV